MNELNTITEKVQKRLAWIETKHKVRVLYACESGSRAWGFPSRDSDYDVRFLYAHPPSWYMAINIENKRDVIEQPIEDNLDLSGWDIRKALQLFRKSNPPLLEWLNSPIVYQNRAGACTRMHALMGQYYSPKSCQYHYLHMARGNYREYLKGDRVWVKKYFYVLRPLLAIKWIDQVGTVMPTEFTKMLDALVEDDHLYEAINNLIGQKRAGCELEEGPRIPVISDFVAGELERLAGARFDGASQNNNLEPLNKLFLELVNF